MALLSLPHAIDFSALAFIAFMALLGLVYFIATDSFMAAVLAFIGGVMAGVAKESA
eukprot:CAMPEP_0185906652 /NCGR_PEP_ID=MMETSP0196C-20130402/5755_1 /TAXON_ID=2932 /ORGANISM="Alexandrium fundyense, Strain CCMP1719" /LENGTH=55 /DNA_ID=CAMNT_0028626449 /DNA_START=21 /DNA_END=188 /DNA_ORIENTATION=-